MPKNEKILVFIPMYNCEKQIVRVLEQLHGEIKDFITEVIIVNNQSTDNGERNVIKYLQNNSFRTKITLLRNNENYQLGGSHKVAFQYAIHNGFDYVMVLHGDDQGRVADFLPLLKSGKYKKYDCCLGTRFMKGSSLIGYSKLRIWGNYGFNILFSCAVRKKVFDLGSGLNLYKVETLKEKYFMKYPDTLYFNACMILATCYYKQKLLFYPISWREEDQISNNKLWKCSISLLQMLFKFIVHRQNYLTSEMRNKVIDNYNAEIIYKNREN